MNEEAVIVHLNDHQKAQEHVRSDNKAVFGFWVYLMTDCVLFASLFAVYAVLRHNVNGGPSGQDLFSPPYVLTETMLLLISSYTSGLAMLAARRGRKNRTLLLFGVTFALGLAFLIMELHEFHDLAAEGNSWQRSGFLSSYFTLVGTHGLHITAGLLWMAVMMIRVGRGSLSRVNLRRLTMLNLFWHFLDVIWIFIFTIVYMFGVIPV